MIVESRDHAGHFPTRFSRRGAHFDSFFDMRFGR